MIKIVDTRDKRASTTKQQVMNDFADEVTFNWITYERDGNNNVKKICVSDDVCLEYVSDDVHLEYSDYFCLRHNTLAISDNVPTDCTYYLIIVTDTCAALYFPAYNEYRFFIFGASKNARTNVTSHGIVAYSSRHIIPYTDNMRSSTWQQPSSDYANSMYNLQLAPLTPISSEDIFTDVYRVVCRKAQPTVGEVLINNTHYVYLLDTMAIPYTPN